jgi:hypothetical protein
LDRAGTQNRQPEEVALKAGNEIMPQDTISEPEAKPALSEQGAAPIPDGGMPPTQPADSSAAKKNDKPAVVTLEVVARSKVRAKPSDQSEIIAELEPGNRVAVLGRSRDYFHVRSVDDKSIRGYVHREDAFFEKTKR